MDLKNIVLFICWFFFNLEFMIWMKRTIFLFSDLWMESKLGNDRWILSLQQFFRASNSLNAQFRTATAITGATPATTAVTGGGKTMGRWLKDRREKKKEETRAHNAQLHAAISVAGVAAAVAAIAAATAASSSAGKDEQMAKTDMAVASAATLVAAQCVEAAEAMGAEREHLASVISSAVNVRSAGDIMTITAGAATGTFIMIIKLSFVQWNLYFVSCMKYLIWLLKIYILGYDV